MSRYSFNKEKIKHIKDEAIRSIIYEIWSIGRGAGVRKVQSLLRSYGKNVVVDGWFGRKSINAINRSNGDRLFHHLINILKGVSSRKKHVYKLTQQIVEQTAYALGVKGSAVYAIATVESRGAFVWKNGKIPILYERHICYRQLKKKHGLDYANKMYKKYPKLCNPKWGGYGKYSVQYGKLNHAVRLFGKEIAYLSCSHGCFQIMGFNHGMCGYASAVEMVEDMRNSPVKGQLRAFSEFVRNYRGGRLLKALKREDWHTVARLYNGSHYARNRYHIKMERASGLYDSGVVFG